MVSTVVRTGQVAHLWAQQDQDFARVGIAREPARGGGGWTGGASCFYDAPRTWFRGPVLYSYNEPIARILRGADGAKVALVSAGQLWEGPADSPASYRKWSPTTSGHMPGHAINSHVADRFTVPSVCGRSGTSESFRAWDSQHEPADPLHALNLEYLRNAYREAVKTWGKRKRLGEWERGAYTGPGQSSREMPTLEVVTFALEYPWHAAERYARAFAVESVNPWSVGTAWPATLGEAIAPAADIAARLDRLDSEWATPEKIAARQASADKREAAKRLSRYGTPEERLAAWKAGGGSHLLSYPLNQGTHLRVTAKLLQTSMGASVPLADAIKVYRFVKAVKDRPPVSDIGGGRPIVWKRNGARVPVGAFQLDRVYSDGGFTAGCHNIAWSEIVSAAEAAGVLDAAPSLDAVKDSAHA